MSVCAWHPQRPEESVRLPGARLTGGYEDLAWTLRMELRPSTGVVYALNCWAISPVHITQFFPTFKEITKTRHPTLKLLLGVKEMRVVAFMPVSTFPRDFHFLFVIPLRSRTPAPSGHLCKGLPLEGGSTKGSGRETCHLNPPWPSLQTATNQPYVTSSAHPHPPPSSWPFSCIHIQPLAVFLGRPFFSKPKDSRHWHVRWSYQIPC